MKQISGVDLFCGIGGLTYGLKKANIKINAGIDNDKTCKYPFEKNNNAKFILKDINEIKGEDLLPYFSKNSYKLIAGCAPCQPYSTHQKNKNIENRKKHSKYGLIMQMLRLIQEVNPEFVTMENVPQLMKDPLLKEFLEWFDKNGYSYFKDVIDLSKYGVPQKRRRFVFMASRIGKVEFPKTKYKFISIEETISHLSRIEAGQENMIDPLHTSSNLSPINLKRIKASKPGGTWKDWDKNLLPNCYKKNSGKSYSAVYGRVDPKKPSPTLTTQFTRYGTGRYGHYEQNRALSLREGSLIQTFPLDYDFGITKGITRTNISKHIGNAVPPLLGEIIGKTFNKIIKKV